MICITTDAFIKSIRRVADRSLVYIDVFDDCMNVKYGKKVHTIKYQDSIGSLVNKDDAMLIVNSVRIKFQ